MIHAFYLTAIAALTALVLATRKRDGDWAHEQEIMNQHISGRLRELDHRLIVLEAQKKPVVMPRNKQK